jgi:hypothetical protein
VLSAGASRPASATERAGSADLVASVSVTPSPAVVGQSYTVTLGVRNKGPDEATNVRVTGSVTNMTITWPAFVPCSGPASGFTCDIGTLAAGAAPSVTVSFTDTAPGTHTGTLTVSSTTADPDTSNNTASATVNVVASSSSPPPPPPPPAVDKQRPKVTAVPATVKHGTAAKLRYWVSDNSGRASVQGSVYFASGRLQHRTARKSVAAEGRTAYSFRWVLPRAGRYRFCVKAWDARGNASPQSCARVTAT